MRHRLAKIAALVAVAMGGLALAIPAAHAEDAPNGYPYCNNGSSSDPDGDGWGWENEASCVVRGGSADTGNSGGNSGGNGSYPVCANGSASDPDGDGWGWENGQSCTVSGGSNGGGGTAACPSGVTCGSYTVSGLGARKRQVTAAGANTLDLATAMLETDNMQTNYPYGDNKTGLSANFGIFKQNWDLLTESCSRFRGQSADQWNNGAVLNSNLSADIQCLHESQNYYGVDRWFAGHRNGRTGLNNPNTADIQRYRTAVYWLRDQIASNSANLTNDTRFWVNVPPI